MHFNRTQFATKRHVRLLALAILILVFLLSSCTDGEIEKELNNLFSSPIQMVFDKFDYSDSKFTNL